MSVQTAAGRPRAGMAVKNFIRLRLPGRPDRDVRVRTARDDAAVLEIHGGIPRSVVKVAVGKISEEATGIETVRETESPCASRTSILHVGVPAEPYAIEVVADEDHPASQEPSFV